MSEQLTPDYHLPPYNIYISPKAAQLLDLATGAYCRMMEYAARHLGEDGISDMDNDMTLYRSIQRQLRYLAAIPTSQPSRTSGTEKCDD